MTVSGLINPFILGAVSTDAFFNSVMALDGLVAYWRFSSTTTFVDVSGNGLDGSWEGGVPSLDGDLAGAITPSDGKSVNLGGVAWGLVEDNVAFHLASGCLMGRVQFSAAGIAGEHYVVAKFGTLADGDWGIRVRSDGSLRLFLQDGVTQFNVDTAPGAIEADVEYCVGFAWTPIGAWLLIDGRVAAFTTQWISGWTNNTKDLHFGYRVTDDTISDSLMDEWFLLDRWPTWDEIDELSEWVAGLGYNPAAMNDVGPVGSVAAIEAAIAAADPGDRILVATGTYNAVNPVIANIGEKRNPIVIAPASGNPGDVTFTDPDITLDGCRWVVFDGIDFDGGRFLVDGARYCRITRATCTGLDQPMIMNQPGGMFNRWDHLDFNGTPASAGDHPLFYFPNGTAAQGRNDLLDHTIFQNANATAYDAEAIAPGTSTDHCNHWLGLNVRTCRFEDWLSDNDLETISYKSSGSLFIDATFVLTNLTTRSFLLRHGGMPWIEGCWFKNHNAGGINGGARDGAIIGCRFEDSECNLWQGTVEAEAFYANPAGSPTGRPNGLRMKLIGLTGADTGSGRGSISVGKAGAGGGTNPVVDTEIWETTVSFTGGGHTGTVEHVGAAPYPWTAATEVASGTVGPAADDPLVPAGWK